jgi:hypothetical protein
MNRSSFVIVKRAQDLSQNDMGSQRSLCSIIGRLYTRIDDKGEPVVKPVVDFPDEFPDFLDRIHFHDSLPKHFSRQFP